MSTPEQEVSLKTLTRACAAALLIAGVALLTLILPAEYHIDPTGLGHQLGLTALAPSGKQVVDAAAPATGDATSGDRIRSRDRRSELKERTVEVLVAAGASIEYKVRMPQYAKLNYRWETDGTALYTDLHGEPAGDTSGYFESYAVTTLTTMKGSFTAPFAGSHGWYWRNDSAQPVLVTLVLRGQYQLIGQQ